MNRLGDNGLGECFKPFLSKALINGSERTLLRDSGSSVDLCYRSWISEQDLTGEVIWVKQPLDSDCVCLPIAKVEIEGEFGRVVTKAAVKPGNGDQKSDVYLLGNKTSELIEQLKQNPELLNVMLTRSQARAAGVRASEEELVSRNLEEETLKETLVLPRERDQETESLLTGVTQEAFLSAQKYCANLRSLWEKAKEGDSEFRVRNDRLVRESRSKRGESRTQLCIPMEFRGRILAFCHDEVSGHSGTTKTKDRLLRHFFWPNCYQDVERYVKSCLICQKVGFNGDKCRAPMKLVPIISEVFSRINIDTVGPLMTSDKGNRYLLTAICMSSKYPEAVPLESITSRNVIDALLIVFSRMGFPREVQSDLGTSFTSVLTSEFFNRFGIKAVHSSVRHPQSNPVERMHSSIKRVLKALSLESGKDWERNVPAALFALRTVTHDSTGFTPSELVCGKNLRTPQTLIYENWVGEETTDVNVVEYILDLLERLKRCRDLAVDIMTEQRDKRKAWYDRNAVSRKFKVGDQVLVLATSKPHKMAVNWIGPGTVTGKISETNYLIDLPERRDKATIYHVNLMKPYHKRPESLNLLLDEGPEDIEGEAEIPYPMSDPTQLDIAGIIKDSGLEERVSEEQISRFCEMLRRHGKVFSTDPGCTDLVEMDVKLTGDTPVRAKPYRMSPRQLEILRLEIARMLELGIIEIGQSDYASPMILVESANRAPRPCIDYRRLNAVTRKEFFPLPHIEEVVQRVSAAPFVSVMDLTKGYFQIPLTKNAQRFAAFVTPFGTYLPKKMMFGLVNAPFYFCKLMAQVLGGLEDFAVPYIDDIAVFSSSWEEHVRHVGEVLERLEKANLTVKPAKCRFAQDHVMFLGHKVGSGKRTPNEVKIKAIQDFPTPSTKTQIRAFLGVVGYYSHYIPNYSVIAAPLTSALKGRVRKEKITWTEECENAFAELKGKLTDRPVLYAPDYTREFILQTDASINGAGVVLSQKVNGEEHPVVYLSKKFTKAERNYSTIEQELAAIVFGLKKLDHYLDGQKFVIESDHAPLTFLKRMAGKNARLTRWALCLQQYDYRVVHKAGKTHGNADGLSRLGYE